MGVFQNAYEIFCVSHHFEVDPAQLAFIQQVDTVWPAKKQSWTDVFCRNKASTKPCGFYLYGCVGRGKTVLMRLVFEALSVEKKSFMHFADFMVYVHQLLYDHAHASIQPIDSVIQYLGQEISYLFLDEFQVLEIADAMILSRLFLGLLNRGVQVMITSNLSPDDLYRNGLHYDRFAPFIEILKTKMNVYALENFSLTDYRSQIMAPKKTIFLSETEAKDALSLWQEIAEGQSVSRTVAINDRPFFIKKACKNGATFSFQYLCGRSMGSEDYIVLSSIFDVFFIQNVPVLTGALANEALRFMTLIDILYNRRRKIILTIDAPLNAIWDQSTLSLPLERTFSRLQEIQSETYWSYNIPNTNEEPESLKHEFCS